MSDDLLPKQVVTVAEMARMVGLSRARFYQLMGRAFPWPLYDVATRRPFYNEEQQRACLEVRKRNCGIDGKPILFYARRLDLVSTPRTNRTPKPKAKEKKSDQFSDVVAGLRALGLLSVNASDVAAAVKVVFPNGVGGIDVGEVIRGVFLHMKRQNRNDKVG